MANTTISALNSLTSVANGDLFIIRDVSVSEEKSITAAELQNAMFSNSVGTQYKSGSFTPEVADAATAGNVASGTFNGQYVKIGRQVTVTVSLIDIVTTGMTSGNDLFIRNLPYTAGSVTGTVVYTGSVMATNIDFVPNTYMGAAITDNTNYIRIFETTDAAGADYITVSNITSGTTDIYLTITYFAAS